MAKSRQAGFTLVEVTIVFAISGLLLLIAFVGQSTLRGRTRFDASVDKMAATVAQARNEATSGVNIDGSGDGTKSPAGCNTNANIKNTFAGTVWTADNSALPAGLAKFTVDYYVAQIDTSVDPLGTATGTGCKYDSRALAYPGDLTVNVANGIPSQRGARILFVRTVTGSLVVCQMTDLTKPVAPSFGVGACVAPDAVPIPTAPRWVISVGDPDGRVSSMSIDPSGLARREN